jgi:hypothetical protein
MEQAQGMERFTGQDQDPDKEPLRFPAEPE